jgi:hypothetical protein
MAEETALAINRIPLELHSTPQQSSQLTRLAAFTPTNLTEAMALAKLIASSELAPKDYRGKPGNVLIGMQYAAELGIAPLTGLQNISIINGRAAVWGDLALALVQSHPDYESHKEFWESTGDTRRAVFQIKRKNQELHQQVFSVGDAKTAGLWGKVGPWKTNPDRMLQMRARGFGLRDKFADALKGLRLAEEVMDLPPEKPTRETGTLDVNREMATLTVSPEPNRGHGNEGMIQQPALSQGPGVDQTEKKAEPTMCGECRQIGSHHKLCKYAIGGAQESQNESTVAEASEAASEPSTGFQRVAVKVLRVSEPKKGPNRILSVLQDKVGEYEMSCWHKSFADHLDFAEGQFGVFEISVKKSAKNSRDYTNLEHIIELDGVPFVDDKPADSGQI